MTASMIMMLPIPGTETGPESTREGRMSDLLVGIRLAPAKVSMIGMRLW